MASLRLRFLTPRALLPRHRPLSSTTTSLAKNPNPQRDAQMDREKMNTDANETSKSGTDDTTAKQDEASFASNISDPEDAKNKAGEGNKVNPLDVSPANQEISQPTTSEDGSKESG